MPRPTIDIMDMRAHDAARMVAEYEAAHNVTIRKALVAIKEAAMLGRRNLLVGEFANHAEMEAVRNHLQKAGFTVSGGVNSLQLDVEWRVPHIPQAR